MSAAFLCACAELDPQPDEPGDIPCGSVPVAFAAFGKWYDEPGTRAETSGITTSFESGDAIGVTAYWIKDGGSIAGTAPNFMYNQKVEYSAGTAGDKSSSGTWLYSPVKYWPVSGTVNFYAYYPYAQAGDSRIVLSGNTANGEPTLTYTNSAADIDLLAASTEGLSLVGGSPSAASPAPVTLNFHHLLARVRFTFSATGDNHPVIHALKYDIPVSGKYGFAMPVEWSVSDKRTTLLRIAEREGHVIKGSNVQIDAFTAYLLPCKLSKFSISINNVFTDYTPKTPLEIKAGYQYVVNFVLSEDNSVFITSYTMWKTDDTEYEGKLQ